MRIIKTILGVLCCIFGFIWIPTAIATQNAIWLIGTAVCLIPAILLFRKTKKDKERAYIRKNKRESKKNICNGAVVVKTTYTPPEIPNDIAQDMKRCYTLTQAYRDFEIMRESFKLAGTTHNIDTYVMRHNLAMQKANTLLQAEQIGVKGIKKLKCHDVCTQVIASYNSLRLVALDNYSRNEIAQAEALKTDKGKLNRYIKMHIKLKEFEDEFLFVEEYENLLNIIKDKITALGGSIPESII